MKWFFNKKNKEEGSNINAPDDWGSEAIYKELKHLLKALIKKMEDDIENDIEDRGEEDGKNLISNIEDYLEHIETEYDEIAKALNNLVKELKDREKKYAATYADHLKQKLKFCDQELDETNENSKISRLKVRLTQAEQQLKDYENKIYEDYFLRKYYEFWEKKWEAEINHINDLHNDTKKIREFIGQEINLMMNILMAAINKLNPENTQNNGAKLAASTEDSKEVIKEVKEMLKNFPLAYDALSKFNKPSNGTNGPFAKMINPFNANQKTPLNHSIDYESKNLEATRLELNKNRPILQPKSLIKLYYFLSFLILFGEFFLINQFLVELIGQGKLPTFTSNPIGYIAIYVFCIAYPLGIGMIFKIILSTYSNKEKYLRQLSSRLLMATIVALFFVSIPNAMNVLGVENQVIDYIQQLNSQSSAFYNLGLIGIKTVCLAIFLFILTIVLSAVGAILFNEASEMHKSYYHVTRNPIIKILSPTYKEELENRIKKIEKEIKKLWKTRDKIADELSNNTAKLATEEEPENYNSLFNVLKAKALRIYRHGFEKGRDRAIKDLDEAQIFI